MALGKHAALSLEIRPPPNSPSALKPLVFSAPSPRLLQQWLVALRAACHGAAAQVDAGSLASRGGGGTRPMGAEHEPLVSGSGRVHLRHVSADWSGSGAGADDGGVGDAASRTVRTRHEEAAEVCPTTAHPRD